MWVGRMSNGKKMESEQAHHVMH